jgi:hypothetical protein
LEIVEALRKGNLSHREIGKRFNRAQSTISKIARDVGIMPNHRRKRSPAAKDVEGTYGKEQRVAFADRFLGVLEDMVEGGGLTPKDMREVGQAAKLALDARRAEDIEPDSREGEEPELWPIGLGEMSIDLSTPLGRQLKAELEERAGPGADAWREAEYRRAVEELTTERDDEDRSGGAD